MNDSALISVGLPIALAIIMFGLGLSLTVGDFTSVARRPKTVAVALVIQIVILPCVAFALLTVFDVEPLLAVGVMLLAASPGGTTANLFSHLFHGDVALNVTLTAINSIFAVITVPLVTNLAIDYFNADGDLGLEFAKVVQVIAIVLIPVAAGMLVRRKSPQFALRADRSVRIFSMIVLAIVAIGALLGERENLVDYFRQVGVLTFLFGAASLCLGYAGARLFRVDQRQAVAISMEVGIHNTTVALTIALSVLGSNEVAVPIAVYAVVIYILAPPFGYLITRNRNRDRVRLSAAT